jgi:hypothetical protein
MSKRFRTYRLPLFAANKTTIIAVNKYGFCSAFPISPPPLSMQDGKKKIKGGQKRNG